MFGFFEFRSRCLIAVMDKWAKCTFLCVVGGGEHIYIYMGTILCMGTILHDL